MQLSSLSPDDVPYLSVWKLLKTNPCFTTLLNIPCLFLVWITRDANLHHYSRFYRIRKLSQDAEKRPRAQTLCMWRKAWSHQSWNMRMSATIPFANDNWRSFIMDARRKRQYHALNSEAKRIMCNSSLQVNWIGMAIQFCSTLKIQLRRLSIVGWARLLELIQRTSVNCE